MRATIEVRGLRKSFGPALALDGMTFTVAPGQVTGFIGPNGAGKTTTMRVILGLDAPDAGTALVGGQRYASLRRPLTPPGVAAGRRPRCSRAVPAATTCCGWRTPRAWTPPGPTRCSSRPGWQGGPAQGGRVTRWACGSGWASPPRCSATRRRC